MGTDSHTNIIKHTVHPPLICNAKNHIDSISGWHVIGGFTKLC